MSRSDSAACSRRQPGSGPGAAHVPELPERGAALVGRVLAPEQLAGHLMVEADHVSLGELLAQVGAYMVGQGDGAKYAAGHGAGRLNRGDRGAGQASKARRPVPDG